MATSIQTVIEIAAPRDHVWSLLTDFKRYHEWNPFIVSLSGELKVGSPLIAVIKPPGRSAQTFHPIVKDVVAGNRFHWQGSLPIPGLFTGTHMFDLSEAGGATRFSHSETFGGLLVPFLGGILRASEQGFNDMNRALKQRAEQTIA